MWCIDLSLQVKFKTNSRKNIFNTRMVWQYFHTDCQYEASSGSGGNNLLVCGVWHWLADSVIRTFLGIEGSMITFVSNKYCQEGWQMVLWYYQHKMKVIGVFLLLILKASYSESFNGLWDNRDVQSRDTSCGGNSELVCRERLGRVVNTNLCLFPDYNKFELPIKDGVNIIDIGIDITDVLRINDKAGDTAKNVRL